MRHPDESATYVDDYRASVGEVEAPDLDRVIIAAATWHAVRRRLIRRTIGPVLLSVAAVLGIGAALYARHGTPALGTPDVTPYGVIEGITRPYLLEATPFPYSGPGLAEDKQ